MKHQIEMIEVGGADCFIVQYFPYNSKPEEYKLALIDCGNYSNGEDIVEHLRKYYPGHKIDLAFVTHPDNDHFGGFLYMLELIARKDENAIAINQFIVNDPGNHITADDVKRYSIDANAQKEARSVYTLDSHGNLLEVIDKMGINRSELFANNSVLNTVIDSYFYAIGPTCAYFESLVPEMRHDLEPVAITKTFADTARDLDSESDDASIHNASSLILVFAPESLSGRKYLFVGDAARQSFDNIPATKRPLIKNCHWLKVPHHGSIHNLTTSIVEEINPEFAAISAPGNEHHPADEIIKLLKDHNTSVYSTNVHGTLMFQRGTPDRPGWNFVAPL